MYDEIKGLRISDLDKTRLDAWIETEVVDLANDFGQRIDDEMTEHICKRLRNVLTTAYRSWHVGDVHAVFQIGLAGGYGSAYKVTVKTLLHFLKAGQNQRSHLRANAAEIEKNKEDFNPKKDGKIETEFLIWASTNMISVGYLDPKHDPLATKTVSPKILEMAEEYREAKEMNLLNAFEKRLKNESV